MCLHLPKGFNFSAWLGKSTWSDSAKNVTPGGNWVHWFPPFLPPKNRGRKKGREISRKLQGKKGGNTQTIPNLKHPFCLKTQHKARAEIPNAGGKSRDRYFSLASGCGCLRKIRSRNTSSTLYIKPTTFRTRVCSYLYVFVSCALGSSLQEISWSDYIHDKHLRIPSHTFAYLRIFATSTVIRLKKGQG